MTIREPPPIATWLLKRFATGYRSESLLGDLLEEYQSGRTSGWYWRETAAALLVSATRRVRLLYAHRAARLVPALVAQCALIVGVAVLSEQHQHLCPSERSLLTGSILLFICAAVTEFLITLVAWLCSVRHPTCVARKSDLFKRSIAAFIAVGLGSGALTWASTTACPAEPLACVPSSAITCLQTGNGIADGR